LPDLYTGTLNAFLLKGWWLESGHWAGVVWVGKNSLPVGGRYSERHYYILGWTARSWLVNRGEQSTASV